MQGVYDVVPTANGFEKVYRNMRMLKIAEDGSYVRIWASRGMSCEDDSVWFPKHLFKEVTDLFGPPQPTSQMSGNDKDLILKCNNPQWTMAAEWQSNVMHHMINNYGVEVIFSHFHGPDMSGHTYMRILKDRESSKATKEEMQGIPHYMIDIAEPTENYSLARYVEDATKIIQNRRPDDFNVIVK